MHGPTARPLPLPYLQIINPLEGFVGAEDQASNKPADMFKSFRTTKDLSKTFHPLGQDLGHPNNRQHGSTLSFSISFFLSSSIHPFFPITFQVVRHTVLRLIGLASVCCARVVTSASDCRLSGCLVSATSSQATALTSA